MFTALPALCLALCGDAPQPGDPTRNVVAAHLTAKLDATIAKTADRKGTRITFGCQSTAKDTDLLLLRHFPDLTELVYIGDQDLSEKGYARIAALKRVRMLRLVQDEVSPGALEQLARMPNLEHLELLGLDVCEELVVGLKKLPHLKTLRLRAGNMSDASAKWFAGFPKLEQLHIPRGVTDEGLTTVQKALPKTKVSR